MATPISTLRKMIGDRRAPGRLKSPRFYLVFMVNRFAWLRNKNKQLGRVQSKITSMYSYWKRDTVTTGRRPMQHGNSFEFTSPLNYAWGDW